MTPATDARIRLDGTSVADLFAGYADAAYSLPEPLAAAGRAYLAVDADREAARIAHDGVHAARRRSLADKTTDEEAEDALRQARIASHRALAHAETLIALTGDDLVRDYLRPAHDVAIDAVREALPALAGVDLTDTASVARAGAKAGAAFLVVAAAGERLEAIERARECIFDRMRLGGVIGRDPYRSDRLGGALRDTPRWPETRTATIAMGAKVRTGPAHPLERVAWLAGEGQGWCPTFAEWQTGYLAWVTDPARNGQHVGPVRGARPSFVTHGRR